MSNSSLRARDTYSAFLNYILAPNLTLPTPIKTKRIVSRASNKPLKIKSPPSQCSQKFEVSIWTCDCQNKARAKVVFNA